MAVSAPVRRLAAEVVRLAWPAIVAGLVSTLVFFTDRLMLGWYRSDALGSMQVSGPVLWSVFSVFGAFLAGTLAVIGRAVGADRPDVARDVAGASIAFAGLVGIVVGVAGFLARDRLGILMAGGGSELAELRALASTYMGVVFPAAPLSFIGQAGTVVLHSSGDTRTPMRIGVLAGLANLVVSGALLFGWLGAPRLGIAGAAIGTAVAFGLQAGLVLVALAWREGPVRLSRPPRQLFKVMGPVFRIAVPAFGEKAIFHMGFLAFAALVGRLGEVATAANQSLIAIESIGFIAAHGFGIAAGTLVAQKLGAGRPEEATICGWLAMGIGAGSLCLVSLVFLAVPEWLIGLFTQDPAVIQLGVRCLRVAAIAQPLMAVADGLAGALRGAGDTRSPMAVALVGPVCVRLLACWVLAVQLELGLLGIWIGTTLDWAVRGAALAVVFARGRWRTLAILG